MGSTLEQELSVDDLTALKSAIDAITLEKGKNYVSEHEVLSELKQEMVEYEEDLDEMQEVAESTGRKNLKQTKGAARLFKKMQNILNKTDLIVSKLKKREEKLRGVIESLGQEGENSEDQEEHLVTVQDLLGAVKGLQEVPDSRMLEKISEVVASMDEDSDGVVKLEHVNKVIEILGSDNVEASGKQVKQIIDLIGKEELLEVESRIEKILGKIPSIDIQPASTVIDLDLTENPGEAEIADTATDLTEGEAEPHIVEMFSRDNVAGKEKTENVREDNTVKDVTDAVKDKEEEPVKVPQK